MVASLFLVQIIFCSKLFRIRRDSKIQSILQTLIRQNNLTGFLFTSYFYKYSPENIFVRKEIIRHASQLATVSLFNSKVKMEKYDRNVTKFYSPTYANVPLTRLDLVASDNVGLLIVIDSKFIHRHDESVIIQYISSLVVHFTAVQGVSKILLVPIVQSRFTHYKRLLKKLIKSHLYNVEVLEIQIKRKNSLSSFTHRVIQLRYYENVYTNKLFDSKVKFFKASRNLHNHKLFTGPLNEFEEQVHSWHTKYKFALHFVMIYLPFYYPIETAMKMLNSTLICQPKRKFYKDIFFEHLDSFPNIYTAKISGKPVNTYFIVPTLYDKCYCKSYNLLVTSLLAIAAVIVIFWLWSKTFEFDSRTWQPITIFSMIIGICNPRNPKYLAETVTFMCLILIGFFFGSDLIFGLSAVTLVQETERSIESPEDLNANNISIMLTPKIWIKSNKTIAEKEAYWPLFRQMLIYKNVSVSSGLMETLRCQMPDRIIINDRVAATKSNILDIRWGVNWLFDLNYPLLHVINYNILRFNEGMLSKVPRAVQYNTLFSDRLNFGKLIAGIKELENQPLQIAELKNSWMILAIGNVAAIAILMLEIFLVE